MTALEAAHKLALACNDALDEYDRTVDLDANDRTTSGRISSAVAFTLEQTLAAFREAEGEVGSCLDCADKAIICPHVDPPASVARTGSAVTSDDSATGKVATPASAIGRADRANQMPYCPNCHYFRYVEKHATGVGWWCGNCQISFEAGGEGAIDPAKERWIREHQSLCLTHRVDALKEALQHPSDEGGCIWLEDLVSEIDRLRRELADTSREAGDVLDEVDGERRRFESNWHLAERERDEAVQALDLMRDRYNRSTSCGINEKLDEAVALLRWYADEDRTWKNPSVHMCGHGTGSAALTDRGRRAREFLRGMEPKP